MPKEQLEHYLKQATQGLNGKKRAQVLRELRGNLPARANEFQAFGSSESQALEKALDEFGAARAVSKGFYEVYTMPILNKWTAAAGLIGIAAFLSLNATASGVNFTLEAPVPVCAITSEGKLNAELCTVKGESWLELNSLVETFQANKVPARVEVSEGTSLPKYGAEPTQRVTLLLPGQAPIVLETLKGSGQESVGGPISTFSRDGKRYISTETFVAALGKAQIPLKVSGFINPTLELANVQIELGSVAQPVNLLSGLERMILNLVNAQHPMGLRGKDKPLEVPRKVNAFNGFDTVWRTSGIRYFVDIKQYPQKLVLPDVPGKFFLLLTKNSTLCCSVKPKNLLNIELLERQPDNTLETLSLPVDPEFVRSNQELREGPNNAVWLLPVNFAKPNEILDTKNPVLPLSSDVGN